MTKAEFEKLAGSKISQEQFDQIETVYMWHPAISGIDDKTQIVQLWRLGVIPDLLNKAYIMHNRQPEQEENAVHNYAVTYLNLDTGIVGVATFTDPDTREALRSFRACYRHAAYQIISVAEY